MPKITAENTSLDFTCVRCNRDCTKVSYTEPELGYISSDKKEFIGPICQDCFDELPAHARAIKKFPETAFLVVIKSDGEGAYVTTEGIELKYLREPTSNDVVSGCYRVMKDVEDAIFAQKLANLMTKASQQSRKLVIPGK
mgnify:CR=1 FL=1